MKERHENKFIKDMCYDLSKQPFDFRVFETIRFLVKIFIAKELIQMKQIKKSLIYWIIFLILIARLSQNQRRQEKKKKRF